MPFIPANVAEGAGVALVAVAFGWVMHPAIGVAIVGLFLVAAAVSSLSLATIAASGCTLPRIQTRGSLSSLLPFLPDGLRVWCSPTS